MEESTLSMLVQVPLHAAAWRDLEPGAPIYIHIYLYDHIPGYILSLKIVHIQTYIYIVSLKRYHILFYYIIYIVCV